MGIDLSFAETYAARCPICDTAFEARAWRLVDIGARPALEARLRDGSLQRSFCPVCIGPGVERTPSFMVLRAGAAGYTALLLLPMNRTGDDFRADADVVWALLAERCRSLGINPETVKSIGSGVFETIADIDERLDSAWDARPIYVDTENLQPVQALLGTHDCAHRRDIVLGAPDVVRPGLISFLAELPDYADRITRAEVTPILRFLTHVTRRGLDHAMARCREENAWIAAMRALPKNVSDDFVAALEDTGGDEAALDRLERAAEALLPALAAKELGPLRAMLWNSFGGRWREVVGGARAAALARARSAYERTLAERDLQSPTLMAAHLGLSAAWEDDRSGDLSANVERALGHAEAARKLAQDLSNEDLALVQMEIGILLTRRFEGDPFVNRSRARDAFAAAPKYGVSARTRTLVTFNNALTFVEENTGNVTEKVGIGIMMLRRIQGGVDALTSEHQQNFHQSLGVALLKRFEHDPSDPSDLGEAARHLARAFEVANERRDVLPAARLLVMMADVEMRRMVAGQIAPDVQRLMRLLDAAGAQLTPENAPADHARLESTRAHMLETLAAPGTADEEIIEALARAVETLPAASLDERRRTSYRLATRLAAAGRHAEGARAFQTAADAAEALFAGAATDARRAEEVAINAEIHAGLVGSLARVATTAAARWQVVEAMERGRARQFLDEMGGRPLPPPDGVPEALLAEERELRVRLDAALADTLQAALSMTVRAGGAGWPGAPARLQTARDRFDAVMRMIAAASPAGTRYVALRRPNPPDRRALRMLCRDLAPGTGILAFYAGREGFVGAFLSAGARAPVVSPLPLSAQDIEAGVASFQRDVVERISPRGIGRKAQHGWQALGARLFGPFAGQIAKTQSLTLVPFGPLHALPLHALDFDGEPLIAHAPTLVVPSLGVLHQLHRARAARDGTIGTALVLCHATTEWEAESFEGEARDVATRLGTAAILDARRANLLEVGPGVRVLHLCCHGRFAPRDPLGSAVLLADGEVTAAELLNLKLDTTLVCLSACETGKLAVGRSDAIEGFGRALLQAGSDAVLLTLWSVVSETTRFWMRSFYEALPEPRGEPRGMGRAHRDATLATRAAYPDPVFWAPMVLTGLDV